ncbi:hypothetical protein [Virgibacillus ihumii]|uniref:hypothetical protein n=1 Tax=Virgibacillus ihumii TaxID=2686091 RepID=UPI00157DE824|nr:hypothetical protein [Virgibacillus ihumii]
MRQNININNTKVGVTFNIIIAVLAVGVIASAIDGWDEMKRAPFYLVLGIVILFTRIWRLYKAKKHTS